MRQMKYRKIAETIVRSMVEELAALLHRSREPNLYYSLEKHILDAMEGAYREGYDKAMTDVLKKVSDFDSSKDSVGS